LFDGGTHRVLKQKKNNKKVVNSKFKNFEKDLVTNALFLRKTPFQQKMAFLFPKIIFLTIKNDNISFFFSQKITFSVKKSFFDKKIANVN
jgi:hypothetical protein